MITKQESETLSDFQNKVDVALVNDEKWVETSPAIIKYFNRQGLGKAKYFDYKNIRVCEYGQSESIQKELDRQLGEIVYGTEEGKVQQVKETQKVASAKPSR